MRVRLTHASSRRGHSPRLSLHVRTARAAGTRAQTAGKKVARRKRVAREKEGASELQMSEKQDHERVRRAKMNSKEGRDRRVKTKCKQQEKRVTGELGQSVTAGEAKQDDMALLQNCLTFSKTLQYCIPLLLNVVPTVTSWCTHASPRCAGDHTLLGESSACTQLVPVLLLIKTSKKNSSAKDTIWSLVFIGILYQTFCGAFLCGDYLAQNYKMRVISANLRYINAAGTLEDY